MPGVLIIEALAQTGAVAILCQDEWKGKTAYFAGINNAKFNALGYSFFMPINCSISQNRNCTIRLNQKFVIPTMKSSKLEIVNKDNSA